MKFEQLLELIEAVSESKVTTFKFEEGETKVQMKIGAEAKQIIQVIEEKVVATAVESQVESDVADESEDVKLVTCPLVGTFYAAPSEEAEAFVQVGVQVKKGQNLAIVEAMKLMNDITSEYDGEVIKILVQNGERVEYGQPLFAIKSF